MSFKSAAAIAAFAFSFPVLAEQSTNGVGSNTVTPSSTSDSSIVAKVGAEMWWVDTKVNEIRRDKDTTSSYYAIIEHDLKYVPNARLRHSSVDADYMAFDKLDLTLYYSMMEHELLHFDFGITLSDLSNTSYIDANGIGAARESSFDEFIWAWYGYGEITVPNTNFDVIGEMNFGDSSGIKSTDLMAGVQYRIPMKSMQLALRGGYRVIDLESDTFELTEGAIDGGKPFIFADGWFAGAELAF